MTGHPTLVSLARDLGVSRQTVSNAINAPDRVNAKTLARVRAAIADSGYRPRVAGRQLRTRRSMNLATRLHRTSDGINGAVLDRFLHALTDAAQVHGYRLTLFTAADDAAEVAAVDELLSTVDIDGFVLTGSHHDDARTEWLLRHDVPFVSFGRPWCVKGDPYDAPHPWVDVDGSAGTAEATRMLLDAGHRRIGFLGWPPGSGVGDDRRQGWLRTIRDTDLGAEELDRLSLHITDTVGNGALGGRELLSQGATAVVCASDSLALGAFAAWRQAGADLTAGPAVVGFDDTPVAAAIGLSSVRQPIERAAAHAVAVLHHRLSGETATTAPEPHLLLASALVSRRTDPFLTSSEPASDRSAGVETHKETVT